MKKVFLTGAWLLSALATGIGMNAGECSITSGESGNLKIENSLMEFEISPNYGREFGIRSWHTKWNSREMLDANAQEKNIFGEHWDTLEYKNAPAGLMFRRGNIYTPKTRGTAPDGSAAGIVQQIARKDFTAERTIVIRRDWSVAKITFRYTNLAGKPVGGALRLFSAFFPGALTGTTFKNTSIFMPTKKGVLELDQNLKNVEFGEKYGGEKFFLDRWNDTKHPEPRRWWTPNVLKTPPLSAPWACELNRNNGSGLFILSDEKPLIGFYNCPRITLETVCEAIALAPGESWEITIFSGTFEAPHGSKVAAVNELFVTLDKGILPLFKGKITVNGKSFEAAPDKVVPADPAKDSILGYDTAGKLLGKFENGVCAMTPDDIEYITPEKPWFFGSIYDPSPKTVRDFLKKGNFTIYCGPENRQDIREMAKELSLRFGVGLADICPPGRVLAIGSADKDMVINNIGNMHNSVNTEWPAKGEGAIQPFDRIDLTNSEAVVVAGSDTKGVLRALKDFEKNYAAGVKSPEGFEVVSVSPARMVYPFSRPDEKSKKEIKLRAAKGEYESAQLLISAFGDRKDLSVTVSDLVNVKTGKPLSRKYISESRKMYGPVRVRFVEYYPYDRKPGDIYYPDPLMDRKVTTLPAGESLGVFLTFIVPESAEAGVYRGTVRCKTDSGEKTIPVELEVRDFTLPRDGMVGEAYTDIDFFDVADNAYNTNALFAFVRDMVEHGIRFIHLPQKLYSFRTDKNGAFKGLSTDSIESSEDGVLMVDFTEFDRVKKACDQAGKPFDLIYLLNMMPHDTQARIAQFEKDFPKRHERREGNKSLNSRYLEEVLVLFKKHLDKKGWTKSVYLKIGDEPRDAKWWYETLSQAAKGSGLQYCTAHGSADLTNVDPNWSDIWQPIYGSYDPAVMEKIRKAGKKISFYNCGPPPQTGLRAGASQWRSYLWQAAKYDIDIVCWWGVQCWNYYARNGVWNWQSDFDSIVYPEHPKKDPFREKNVQYDRYIIDSIRWEIIRDGMEDAWYVNELRREIDNAKKAGKTSEAAKAENVLDSVWENVFPTKNHYKPDYEVILDSRDKIADAIIDLKKVNNGKLK